MEMRYVAPCGMVGTGFQESSFRRLLAASPAFVGCDGGTTDDGPYQLGAGKPMFPRSACKRDLEVMLAGTRAAGIPLLIGSCGGAGGRINLQWTYDIVREIAREKGLHFKVALIDSEPDREFILRRYRAGRVRALDAAPQIDEALIAGCDHVVAMMGIEPFQAAVEAGADVVLCGRASDTSIFAALPVKAGLPAGLAWHAAKILECGAAAVVHRFTADGMLCTIDGDGFIVEPANPKMQCSTLSVAAHTLYENGDPFHLHEPGGVLDTTDAVYEAVDDRRVRVSGSRFDRRPYTVKLEGARQTGYQSLFIGAVRDPVIMARLPEWIASMKARIRDRVDAMFGRDMSAESHMNLRVYGHSGVMGDYETRPQTGSEACIILDFIAADQETAHAMAQSGGHLALHHPVADWQGFITGLAVPYAPHVIDRGPVYEFALNHVMELDDPLEACSITYEKV